MNADKTEGKLRQWLRSEGRFRQWLRSINWFKVALQISLIAALWSVSFCVTGLTLRFYPQSALPKVDSMTTLLFGASSIALFLFSIIFAAFALVGWQSVKEQLQVAGKLKDEFRNEVAELNQSFQTLTKEWETKLNKIESESIIPVGNEMMGRTHSVLGYLLGEISLSSDRMEVVDEHRLREAISLCQLGYDYLKEGDDAAEFMALNNLIFYLSFSPEDSRSQFILEQAKRLLMAAQEHDSVNLLLTACRAILRFSVDEQERQRALTVLESISLKHNASQKEKKEASDYLASFRPHLIIKP